MRTPKGELITAYDLHDVEDCGDIKYDVLSVEGLDKIHNCIDLLCDYGYAERKNSLKETYESLIGIYNIERESPQMWKMVWNHEIQSLFQMEKESGIKGIAATHPKSVKELATLNSVIRLMAPEKGAEQPLDMWVRYRENIEEWKNEMKLYGLNEEEIEWLMNYPDITDGIAESQECLMKLVQEERLGGNNLNFADKCRKGLAKKDGPLFKQCEEEFFENAKNKNCSSKLVHYVWDILLRVQRNYSFNKSHTLAYSLIALQEMNLAYKYPTIFWNCACLIADSGGAEIEEVEYESDEETDGGAIWDSTSELSMEDFADDDSDDEDDEEEDEDAPKTEKKKKAKSASYGKIASAIGKMKMNGIDINPPDINKSTFTFSPDVENSIIRYGMRGIVKVGEDVIKRIMDNRPYSSPEDFLSKVKITKPQMVNLIKAGAFDEFGDRIEIMKNYITSISEPKKRITLQNMKMLIDFGLIPDEYDLQRRVYNFNKYLKKFKWEIYYLMDNIAFNFFEKNFDIDILDTTELTESGFMIKQTRWDAIYQKHMDIVRPYVKTHSAELLEKVNNRLINDMWNKYCLGNISKWEMDSISCYFHEHELEEVDEQDYGFIDFFDLPENPEIERIVPIKGKQIPLFKIRRIMGTVLDKDKAKKTITLLTKSGVVIVKIFSAEVFSHYDKQISQKNEATSKKKIIEKSWLSRGNKIIVTGIRCEDSFVAKKYKNTPFHFIELITEVKNGKIKTRGERAEV